MRYLQPAVFTDLARDEPAGVVFDLSRPETCRVEEQQLDFAGAVGQRGHEARFPAAYDSRADDFSDEYDLFSGLAVRNPGDFRLVEVAARDIVQQFGDGSQPCLAQGFNSLGAESGKLGDVHVGVSLLFGFLGCLGFGQAFTLLGAFLRLVASLVANQVHVFPGDELDGVAVVVIDLDALRVDGGDELVQLGDDFVELFDGLLGIQELVDGGGVLYGGNGLVDLRRSVGEGLDDVLRLRNLLANALCGVLDGRVRLVRRLDKGIAGVLDLVEERPYLGLQGIDRLVDIVEQAFYGTDDFFVFLLCGGVSGIAVGDKEDGVAHIGNLLADVFH